MTSDTMNDIWVLADDRAGNRSQAFGVATRLQVPFRTIDIAYGPWVCLPNWLLGASCAGLTDTARAKLKAPWPRLVVAAGRRTAPVARWIKREGGAQTRLLQIMDPGAGYDEFDLICRPAHDLGASGPNTLTIDAAPHGLTRGDLDRDAESLPVAASTLPKPRIALLIGGSTRRRQFTDTMARTFIDSALNAASELGGRLMATTSRRTGEALDVIAQSLADGHYVYRWDSDDDNPYRALLGAADAVIVTGESVSMCSEACITGKPVYIFAPNDLITDKHARLHARLYAGGYARPFEGTVDIGWTPPTLDVASTIADEAITRGFVPER